MQALDADALEVGLLTLLGHLHLDPAVFGDRLVVLGDLVVLGQIGIEILLAVELAVLSDMQIQGQRGLHRILEHLLVEHRQGARQTAHHRVDVGVGVVAERGGRRREDLAGGAQLHVGLQADHRLPGRLCIITDADCARRWCCCHALRCAWADPMEGRWPGAWQP